MNCRAIETLKAIALMGGRAGSRIALSSAELGRRTGVSQQTASAHILDLLEDGLITRSFSGRKQVIGITEKGMSVLQSEYLDYRRIFEGEHGLVLRGHVVSGLGEGRYYLSQQEYAEQIERLLGFRPYPGTLNIKLRPGSPRLPPGTGRLINGFEKEGRAFGDVYCFPASIDNMECAVIIPRRTHHSDVVEVIAEKRLRDLLGLKDGDALEIEVFLE